MSNHIKIREKFVCLFVCRRFSLTILTWVIRTSTSATSHAMEWVLLSI